MLYHHLQNCNWSMAVRVDSLTLSWRHFHDTPLSLWNTFLEMFGDLSRACQVFAEGPDGDCGEEEEGREVFIR